MGAALDAIKAQQEANDEKAKEMLDVVHKMMIQKIAATASKMEDGAIEDKSLPIVAIVDKSEKYKIKVTEAPDKDISDGVDELLSGNFLGTIKSLLKVALDEFLGNTSVGESEKSDFHVVFANNSLLRLDYMIYKYDFSSKGLLEEQQNAFCYYMQVGVLDLEKVNSQILLYELTRAIGEENLPKASQELAGLAKFANNLYLTIHELGAAAITGRVEPEGSGGKSGGSGGKSGGRGGGPQPKKEEEDHKNENGDD